MRTKPTLTLAAAAVVGVGLAAGGAWWKLGDGDEAADPAAVASAAVASAPAASAAPAVAPAPVAPEPVPEVAARVPAPEVEEAAPEVEASDAQVAGMPKGEAASQEVAQVPPTGALDEGEVVYPSSEEVMPAAPLEEPEFVEVEPVPQEGAFAPVASQAAPSAPAVDPDYAQLEDFVRTSVEVFGRNAAYGAAIARAQADGDTDRAEALRMEMAAEAQSVILRGFPWGFERYVELAEAVRADPELAEEAAYLMEGVVAR